LKIAARQRSKPFTPLPTRRHDQLMSAAGNLVRLRRSELGPRAVMMSTSHRADEVRGTTSTAPRRRMDSVGPAGLVSSA
jgi:hypothetical protein